MKAKRTSGLLLVLIIAGMLIWFTPSSALAAQPESPNVTASVEKGRWACWYFTAGRDYLDIKLYPAKTDQDLYLFTRDWKQIDKSIRTGTQMDQIIWPKPTSPNLTPYQYCVYGYQTGSFRVTLNL